MAILALGFSFPQAFAHVTSDMKHGVEDVIKDAKLFDTKYGFISRHGGGIRLGNNYASDPINGLLNYGYTVLAGEICKYVNGIGLDPYFGFSIQCTIHFRRWCMN